LPDFAFQLDYAPYQWLFPKMAGVVHHGGSGTTAHALKSGKPSFIVPFGADQFFWGIRTHALSVGPSPLPFKNLEENILADKLKALVDTPSYNNYAGLISSQLESEHGITRAVEIVQKIL
jgi:UDP:flavonoid glycosyltransferase YjiC (YdhE family)